MFSNITTVHACVKVIQTKHLELDDLNEKKLNSSRYYPEPSQKKNRYIQAKNMHWVDRIP